MSDAAGLKQAFRFDAEELQANRQGRLSPAQVQRIAQTARIAGKTGPAASAVFGVIAVAFLIFVVGFLPEDAKPVRPWLFGIAGVLLGAAALVWLGGRRHRRDLTEGRVVQIEGPVRLRQKEVPHLGTAFMVKAGRKTFQLETPEQFAALRDGASYRLFTVPNGRVPIILSVELI